MKRPAPTRPPRAARRDELSGPLRVEDCELHFNDGELAVTFRLSLPAPVTSAAPVPRRVPPRPSKSKP